MHEALVLTARILIAVFVAMNVLIVMRKVGRERDVQKLSARRPVLEPQVLSFAHTEAESLVEYLGGAVERDDRRVLEEILLEHIQLVDGSVRQRLGSALDELGWVDHYVESLRHRNPWQRARAADRLGLIGAERAREDLIRALDDRSSDVRMRAAAALGRIGGATSVRALIGALAQPDRWSTIRMADILAGAGDDVVDELMRAFPRLTLRAKVAALEVLARVQAFRACPWLRERLSDPEPDVRARACHALGVIGDPEAGWSVAEALGDEEWPVRAMAAKAIGRLGHEEAIPALCNALADREWWVRANAGASLRLFGRKGLAALQLMVNDEDVYAGQQAVATLEEAGFIDGEIEALVAPEARQRKTAESFLGHLVRAQRTSRMTDLAHRHPDEKVRDVLSRLLSNGGTPA